jgi:succinate dehydrogenase/fumarate reductase cytochrome b subunit
MYLFDLILSKITDGSFPQLNIPLIANLFQAAGILAGFAFAAGIQLLTPVTMAGAKPKIINSVWAFFCGSGFLTGAFLALGVVVNHEPFINDPAQKKTLYICVYISLLFILVGLIHICGALIYAIKNWGKESEKIDVKPKPNLKNLWYGKSYIAVAVVWAFSLLYAIWVFFLPFIWSLKK